MLKFDCLSNFSSNLAIEFMSKMTFILAVAVAGLLCFDIVSVSGDIGTAIAYDPPYLPTRCGGYDQEQFPEGGLFAAASDGVWDNGAACGRRYRLKCISGRRKPCKNGSIVIQVVDVCRTNPCQATLTLSNKAFDAVSRNPNAKINVEYSHILEFNPAKLSISSQFFWLLAFVLFKTRGHPVISILVNTEEDCFDLLRMNLEAFDRLVYILKGTGRLHDTIHCNVADQLVIFLQTVAHNEKNRTLKCYFKRSGATISYYFNEVMYAIISLHDEFIKPPRGETPQEIRDNPRFWPYIKSDIFVIIYFSNFNTCIICSNMEQFEDPSQSTNDQKKKNTMWTQEIDKCLIEALVLQCNEGNKIDKGFKEVAYTAAANILNATFNLRLNKDNVINWMKTIKRDYRVIETMLGQSGFAFNHTTKKVECNDTVWETYVKVTSSSSS
ncbi:hypothetical protein RHGRI_000638 [Rhododendron griersonianum]|uniref:Expansin-like EG45 domain-containing protein n=1 Tax=Rhododendron griersonianum TaxID=479676 RepID=A0AAV6LKG6_9ERIC|nr:hypothetical protein RHGRI_000638 [Rhododendron griersonianum]